MFPKSFRLMRFALSLALGAATLGLTSGAVGQVASAQNSAVAALKPMAQSNRVAVGADLGPQTQMSGDLRPAWVSSENQVASRSVDLGAALSVTVLMARDPAVQAAFEQFVAQQQNPSSPYYHQWLTPAQVGQLFGPTDSDLGAVTSWLTSQGLTVTVDPNRVLLHVSGTVTTVGNAFHVSFGYFDLKGTQRLSALTEPSIPTALTPVIDSDRKSTRLNSSHLRTSRMPSSA